MDNTTTAINLAAVLGEAVEAITFEEIASSEKGAFMYRVHLSCGEDRYVIEGETGEMLEPIEGEDRAFEAWNIA